MDADLREEIHTELYKITGAAIDETRADPDTTVCARAETLADNLMKKIARLIKLSPLPSRNQNVL